MKKTKKVPKKEPEDNYTELYEEAKKYNIPTDKFKRNTREKLVFFGVLFLFVLMIATIILDIFFSLEYNFYLFFPACITFLNLTDTYYKRVTPIMKKEIEKAKYGTSMEVN